MGLNKNANDTQHSTMQKKSVTTVMHWTSKKNSVGTRPSPKIKYYYYYLLLILLPLYDFENIDQQLIPSEFIQIFASSYYRMGIRKVLRSLMKCLRQNKCWPRILKWASIVLRS